ncbi:MAG: tetratricopeptide repeat protein [bacterium]
MTDSTRQTRMPTTAVLVAYYAILTAFLVASFFPQYRVWGINIWAYFPTYVPLVLFGLGAVIPFAVSWIPGRDQTSKNNKKYVWLVLGLTLLFGLAFYFLRARTHFLGDGYTVLSLLAQENPLVKTRELGEALAHIWMKSAVGVGGENAALLSFQIISISSGILFLITVGAVGKSLFERTTDRLLFWLGLCSGGYMLLFFGYVENYSLFVLSVAVYSLLGLLATRKKISKWLILPPLMLAVFLHILGVTLIPSAAYLLLLDSPVGNAIRRLSIKTKVLMSFVVGLILLTVMYHYYSVSFYFQLALLPIVQNRFTAEGYTLFSLRHLVDLINLLVLLLPGLPVVIAALFSVPLRKIARREDFRYLLILAASCIGAVFIFDPKLGMPRDWDLFAFAGVPLVLLSFHLILENRQLVRSYALTCVMLSVLGLLSLYPRAVGQLMSSVSIAHFKHHCQLDRVKNRTSRWLLIDFFEKAGDLAQAQAENQRWYDDFPEMSLSDSARVLLNRGRVRQAIPLLGRVLAANALYADAWQNLGKCNWYLGRFDEALEYMTIANGLNPYNAGFLSDLGVAYMMSGNLDKAEKPLIKAVALDTARYQPLFNLVHFYALRKRWSEYSHYYSKVITRSDVPLGDIKTLASLHLERGDYARAGEVYKLALNRGLDSSYIDSLLNFHPQLKQFLNLYPIPFDKSP